MNGNTQIRTFSAKREKKMDYFLLKKKSLNNLKKFKIKEPVNKSNEIFKKSMINILKNFSCTKRRKSENSKNFSKNMDNLLFSQMNDNDQKKMRKTVSILEKRFIFLQNLNKNDKSLIIKNLTRNSSLKKKIILVNPNRSKKSNLEEYKKLKKEKIHFEYRMKNNYVPYSYRGLHDKFKRCCSMTKNLKFKEGQPSLFYTNLKKEMYQTNNSYYDKIRKKNYIFISCQNIDDNKMNIFEKEEKSMNTDLLLSKIANEIINEKKENKFINSFYISSINNKGKFVSFSEPIEDDINDKNDDVIKRNILVYHKN